MFVNEEEARRRLEHEENCLRIPGSTPASVEAEEEVIEPEVIGEVRERFGHGRGVPVDPSYRAFLGLMAQTDTIKNVEKNFGSNNVTIQNAKHGRNSNGREVEEGKIVKDTQKEISDRVLDLLLSGVKGINSDEVNATPLVKRTGVLKDIASIHQSFAPKAEVKVSGKIVTIMSPGVGKESDFMSIEVEASV